MQARALRSMAFLLIGGAVTAAFVAYALPVFSAPAARSPRVAFGVLEDDAPAYWYAWRIESVTGCIIDVSVSREAPERGGDGQEDLHDIVPRWSTLDHPRLIEFLDAGHGGVEQIAYGWPLRMFRAEYYGESDPWDEEGGGDHVHGGIVLSDGDIIPIRPVMLGLVGNTLFYTLIVCVPFAIPGMIIRWLLRWLRTSGTPAGR